MEGGCCHLGKPYETECCKVTNDMSAVYKQEIKNKLACKRWTEECHSPGLKRLVTDTLQ